MKIGYVGLGAMGSALAKWLVKDNDVQVFDLNPAAVERFTKMGGTAAASLADLARGSDVVVLCLPRSADVERALFGPGGLAQGLTAGKLVVDQTSGDPEQTRAIARRLAEIGVEMVDAPVAGGVPAALDGKITVMVSGPEAAQDQAMPAFQAMTDRIFRAGAQVGNAQAVKTLNNMMNMVFRIATLELAALGVKLGVPLKALADVLNGGNAGNFSSRSHLPAIIEGRSTGNFALALMLKDNNLAISLGAAKGIPMPLSCLARSVLEMNVNIVGPEAGLDDIISFMARANGADFAKPVGDLDPAEAGRLAEVLATALAAANRAANYEIMSVAARLGLELKDFGRIVNNASAWSRSSEMILEEIRDGTAANTRLSEAVAALLEVERLAAAKGVATVVTGQTRAIFETALKEFGGDAGVDKLAVQYGRIADVGFGT